MQLVLQRRAADHPAAGVRGFLDDFVVISEPPELSAVLRTAAAAGGAVDA